MAHQSGPDLKQHILTVFGSRLTGPAVVLLNDSDYYLPTVDEVRKVLASSEVGRMDMIDNRFDCDDFAFGVKGEFNRHAYQRDNLGDYAFCFGVIMGKFRWATGNHAACVFVAADGQIYLVEPRRTERKKSMPEGNQVPAPDIEPGDVRLFDVKECSEISLILL